nr:PA0069 family radical SAM protein [uncultured Brevundimonas sp.]
MNDLPLATRLSLRRRGASSNPPGRFEAVRAAAVIDGWEASWRAAIDDLPQARTTVTDEAARGVLTRNRSPDLPFDRSVNPYRGCEHGCVYCFARPSHAYMGLSPGLDFETRLFAKPDAPQRLRAALLKPSYAPAPLAIGTNTDPYQPIERDRRIMRGLLETLLEFRHPVMITTKSAMILRDLDVLAPMAARGLASVMISTTTLERDLCRALEPRASPPMARLQTIRRLAAAGLPVIVGVSPVIPGLNDHEMEAILRQARQAGAVAASTLLLRLPREVGPLFEEWLDRHRPRRKARILGLIRQCWGGELNRSGFGARMRGSGPVADMIRQRFVKAVKRFGYRASLPPLRSDLFRRPPPPGAQLRLF